MDQGPVGNDRDGKAFSGDPIHLSWSEATALFGLGTLVSGASYADGYADPS